MEIEYKRDEWRQKRGGDCGNEWNEGGSGLWRDEYLKYDFEVLAALLQSEKAVGYHHFRLLQHLRLHVHVEHVEHVQSRHLLVGFAKRASSLV